MIPPVNILMAIRRQLSCPINLVKIKCYISMDSQNSFNDYCRAKLHAAKYLASLNGASETWRFLPEMPCLYPPIKQKIKLL